jgi:hypothetical protein
MKKILIYIFVIFGITYSFSPLFCIYHKIGDYNTGSRISALTIKDEILYATQYPDFIKILDVTNPEQPLLIGSYQIPDAVIGYITISDTLAFVNTFSSGIQILNISNPANPQFVGSYDYYCTNDIIISDNYAYIAGNDWFYILDISDLLNPICVGQIYGELCDMVLFENMIYGVHASSPNNLRIIDVSDPTNPVLLSNFNLPIYSSAGIAFKDFTAFIAYSGKVWSIDVENPVNPVMMDTLNISNHTSKIIIEENKAIVNNSTSGFVVIDITDPSDMSIISFYDTPGGAGQIDTIEDIVFVADCYSGVQIIDINDPSIQNLYSRFYTGHKAAGFDFKDDNLYISDDMTGLEIISVSEPYNPQLIVSVPINSIGISTSVDILDNIAYCCAGYPVCSVNFVDISDPVNSFWIGEILISGLFGTSGCTNNSNAFVGSDFGNLLIFENTALISEYIALSCVFHLNANETSLFLAEGENGIEIVDICDISNPAFAGIYNTNGNAHNVAIQNNLIFISDGEEGIQIVDVADLQNPIFLSSIKPHDNSNIHTEAVIIDNFLIFFDREWNELFVYDIENPLNPVFENSFQWNSTMNEIIIRDNVLFSCDSYYGVSIIDFAGFLSSEENLINTANYSLSNYPNPFNPETTISFYLQNNRNVKLSIYNTKGQKVKTLVNEILPAGDHSIIWHGRDSNGKRVSSGIYFYKLKAGNFQKVRKMILIK